MSSGVHKGQLEPSSFCHVGLGHSLCSSPRQPRVHALSSLWFSADTASAAVPVTLLFITIVPTCFKATGRRVCCDFMARRGRLLWRAIAAMALAAPCVCFGPPNAALDVSKARPHSPTSRTLCQCTAAASPLHSPAAAHQLAAIAPSPARQCEREGRRVALERAAYVVSLVAAGLAFPAVADSSVIAEASITVKENFQPPASG